MAAGGKIIALSFLSFEGTPLEGKLSVYFSNILFHNIRQSDP
jgi:hypothetical protein